MLPTLLRLAAAVAPALPAAALLPAAGCALFSAPSQVRGNRVTADQLRELVPGTATKADVTTELGSPTAHATFDDNTWIYIGEITRPRIGQVPGILSQDVVVLGFDEGGVLRSVQHLTKKDSQKVTVVARTTPSPGTEASFLQQLFGNIGRFNPGAANTTPGNSGLGGSGFR